jgi:hypothetical protein
MGGVLVELFAIGIGWLVLCWATGVLAEHKGRSFGGFFFLSLFLSPIVGLIVALIVSPKTTNVEEREIERGERVRCPSCAELIRPEARICRFCQQPVMTPTRREVAGIIVSE